MPNFCENDLHIAGPTEDVQALLRHINCEGSGQGFDFGSVVPLPKAQAHQEDIRRELWGTKWNALNVYRSGDDPSPLLRSVKCCLHFETAWKPPGLVVMALHRMFPTCTLHLEFFESGLAFAGGFSCLSEEDWDSEEEWWAPGVPVHAWQGIYHGHRGG